MACQSKKSSWRIQYANSRLRAPLRVHNTATLHTMRHLAFRC
jgi:hypothetical protein